MIVIPSVLWNYFSQVPLCSFRVPEISFEFFRVPKGLYRFPFVCFLHVCHFFTGKVQTLLTIIDWSIFVILAVEALLSSRDCWDNYSKKTTTMALEFQDTLSHPTVTICLGPSRYWQYEWYYAKSYVPYGEAFNISYYTSSDRLMAYHIFRKILVAKDER